MARKTFISFSSLLRSTFQLRSKIFTLMTRLHDVARRLPPLRLRPATNWWLMQTPQKTAVYCFPPSGMTTHRLARPQDGREVFAQFIGAEYAKSAHNDISTVRLGARFRRTPYTRTNCSMFFSCLSPR